MTISKIVTIGVYGYDEASFFKALCDAKVDTFCDIRLRRGVRGSQYAFVNSQKLQKKLAEMGIRYIHRLDLAPSKETRTKQKQADQQEGVLKRERMGLGSAFIEAYKEQCLKDFNSRTFTGSLGQASVVALFCVEKEPSACHRSIVSEELNQELGVEVEHLKP